MDIIIAYVHVNNDDDVHVNGDDDVDVNNNDDINGMVMLVNVGEASGNKPSKYAKILPARHRPYIGMVCSLCWHCAVGATAGMMIFSDARLISIMPASPTMKIHRHHHGPRHRPLHWHGVFIVFAIFLA